MQSGKRLGSGLVGAEAHETKGSDGFVGTKMLDATGSNDCLKVLTWVRESILSVTGPNKYRSTMKCVCGVLCV